jgi:hypothetical protein
MIPGSLLDPNSLLFNGTKNIPAATNQSTDQLTPAAGKIPTYVREDLFRIDHNINDKWSLFGHFIHDAVSQNYATVLWNGDNYPTVGSNFGNPSYSSTIKLTGSLTPNVLLEAAFNYDGNKIAILPVAEGGGNFAIPSGWSAGNYFQNQNALNRLPNISLGTFGTTWGPGNDPWTNGAEDYNEIVNLSVTKGKHALKFGGGYNRYTKNQINGAQTEGTYIFAVGPAHRRLVSGFPVRFEHAVRAGQQRSHLPLRQQHRLGLCRGQLAREHAAQRSVRHPLRRAAARF